MERVLYIQPEQLKTIRFGPSGSFQLVWPEPASLFPVIEEQSGNRIRPYPLPRPPYGEERIGPWKLEGDKLWFGKTFYDGEGMTGIGGFGYFEAADRKYHLFAPPEIARWSVSAIEV